MFGSDTNKVEEWVGREKQRSSIEGLNWIVQVFFCVVSEKRKDEQ
jgi:hypothetical protein